MTSPNTDSPLSNDISSSYRSTEVTEVTEVAVKDSRQLRQPRQVRYIGKYTEYLSRLSKTDKLKAFYADNPEGLTDKDAAALVYGEGVDESKKIADLRANLKDDLVILSSIRPMKYGLTASTEAVVRKQFEKYLSELHEREQQVEEFERKAMIPQSVREYIKQERPEGSLILQAQAHHDKIFWLSWPDLCKMNPELAEEWEADLQEQARLLRMILKEETNTEWAVGVRGFNDRQKIARIQSAQYGHMINVHGEIAARGESYLL